MDDGTVQDRGGSFLCLPSTDVELVGMCHSGSRHNDNFLFRLFRKNAYPQHGLQTSGHPLPEVIPRHTDRRSNMLCPGTAAFHFPGIDFGSLSWIAAGVTFFAVGAGSHLLRYAIGDKPLRLEVLFIVNIFIVILSIIATGY